MKGEVQRLIEATDWDSLGHSYGSASRVPEYLLALTSSDKAVRAKNYWHLDNGIVCQGDLYVSAYHSIRVLIAMLETRYEHGRSDQYKLLVELAYGNAPLEVSVQTFDGREMPLATACKDELRKGIKVYSLDALSENPTVAERASEMLSLLKPVIGLVGAIGAGKSTAAAAFALRGGSVIDADKLGHDALEQPEIRRMVLDRWGATGITRNTDGTIDRRAVAAIVFANPAERAALESMVYPYIGNRVAEEIAAARAEPAVKFVVVDAAVMLEAGWNMCDRLVYIDAPRSVRLARLAARSGWSEADLAARESAQWPADEKKKRCDAVIFNEGSREQLQEKVDQLLMEWGVV